MLDLHIIEQGHDVPLVALPGLLGKRRAARMFGDTIEELIAMMDLLDGDPDLEDGHDAERDQEDRDVAWCEWRPEHRGMLRIGNPLVGEDDEEDDHGEEDDEPGCLYAEDDFDLVARDPDHGAGCPLADPGEWNGRTLFDGRWVAYHGFDQSLPLGLDGKPYPGAAND